MEVIKFAAEKIANANLLIITAGAGIGVDSGLPDFRGEKGFWNAYPMYERLGLSFYDCANPIHFETDPHFGWGFYGHRLELYRKTTPHDGFNIMLNWGKNIAEDYFVVTSNVDGQFQKAGFDPFKIYEIHGSIHHLQCLAPCCDAIWENNENIQIDYETMRAKNIPKCRFCDRVARPNILMFGDYSWLPQRSHEQSDRFDNVIQNASGKNIVVVEVGAGTAVPSIRYTSERLGRRDNTTVIRINLRESQIAGNHISIPMRGLEALKMIDEELNG